MSHQCDFVQEAQTTDQSLTTWWACQGQGEHAHVLPPNAQGKGPWIQRPSQPSPALQPPSRPLQAPRGGEESRAPEIARNAVQPIFKASGVGIGRKLLTAPSPDENILLWLDLVERQTGKPFILDGDAFCVVEEVSEVVEAVTEEERAKELCDVYVASLVSVKLIERLGFKAKARILPGAEERSCLELLAIASGRLACFCRKAKTPERAQAALDSALTASLAIKRELVRLGLPFEQSVEKVLDTLDKRLQDGYQMNAAGSAIKRADQ